MKKMLVLKKSVTRLHQKSSKVEKQILAFHLWILNEIQKKYKQDKKGELYL
tara:strand:- start:1098 stop:1250 length:153 start_codon:yes stop_codon:yes gene_type:complete